MIKAPTRRDGLKLTGPLPWWRDRDWLTPNCTLMSEYFKTTLNVLCPWTIRRIRASGTPSYLLDIPSISVFHFERCPESIRLSWALASTFYVSLPANTHNICRHASAAGTRQRPQWYIHQLQTILEWNSTASILLQNIHIILLDISYACYLNV